MIYKPRNDYVLVKIVDLGETPSGIATPQTSIHGKEFHVLAVGPKVDGLKVGDKVLMLGKVNVEYFQLPMAKDLIAIKQEHVVLVVDDGKKGSAYEML